VRINIYKKTFFLLIFTILLLTFISCGKNSDDNNLSPFRDEYYSTQWYLNMDSTFDYIYGVSPNANIRASTSILEQYQGQGVKIVVIGEGADLNHEDLKGADITGYNEATKTTDVSEDKAPACSNENSNGCFHGTSVLGILAAQENSLGIRGLAPRAKYLFIKVPFYTNKTSALSSAINKAFEKAKSWGANIIICSWGGQIDLGDEATITDVAKNGRAGKGTLIVFSSGNGNSNYIAEPVKFEANNPYVVSVGASDMYDIVSSYSNYSSSSKKLDIIAPGGGLSSFGISTLDPMGSQGMALGGVPDYNLANLSPFVGTSASAPIVAGALALIFEKNPSLTRPDIINILHSTSDKISSYKQNLGTKQNPIMTLKPCSYDSTGFSVHCGYGKLNLEKALAKVPNPS